MSRTGWGTTNFLRSASFPGAAAFPVTIAMWALCPTLPGVTSPLGGMFSSTVASTTAAVQMRVTSANLLQSFFTNTGSLGISSTSAITAGSWFHACCIAASSSDFRQFLNGGDKKTGNPGITFPAVDRLSVGLADGNVAGSAFQATGSLAELAVWNIALADADVAALGKGLSPLRVHPEALVAYYPILGNNSPENNFKSNAKTLTIQGTLAKSAHPRIIMPKRRLILPR